MSVVGGSGHHPKAHKLKYDSDDVEDTDDPEPEGLEEFIANEDEEVIGEDVG